MNQLYFGWAEVSITPDKPVAIAGQFIERISQYVEKPLAATALAVSNGEDHAVMVSVDLVGATYNLIAAVRERVRAAGTDLDPDKIAISATHTHTGPNYPRPKRSNEYGQTFSTRTLLESALPVGKHYVEAVSTVDNPDIVTGKEILDMLVERIAQVVLEAWNNRKPGSYINGFGRAVVGLCRRTAYSDGSAQMWGDTNTAVFTELEGGNDSGIEVLFVFGEDGGLSGIVANLACPAQCVQHRLFLSPDFWGEAKMLLRKYFGKDIFFLTQCSAAGDQCPIDLIRWVDPESDVNDPNITRSNAPKRKADPSMFDLSGMRKVGRRVANGIIEAWEELTEAPISDAVLRHQVRMLQLPLRRVTLAETEAARKAIRDYLQNVPGDVDFNDAARLQVHIGILRRAELQEVMEVMDTETHLIRLGNIVFATNPFELFLDYGNQIKARSPAEQTFVVQMCGGAEDYLPTEKAERGGHYSAFVSSGQVGHIGGEQLVRETLTGIRALFRESS